MGMLIGRIEFAFLWEERGRRGPKWFSLDFVISASHHT